MSTSRAFLPLFLLTLLTSAHAADTTLSANPVFRKDCAKCHGKAGAGRHFGGPSLLVEKVISTLGDDLRNIISNRKGRMPKFAGKLTPEEIDTLIQEIKTVPTK